MDIYPLSQGGIIFILSITIFHYCFLILLMLLSGLVIPTRIAVSVFILLAAVVGYYSDRFNIVIDVEMIRNILQTDVDEMADTVNSGLVIRFFLLGILPLLLIWRTSFHGSGILRELRYKLQTAILAIVVMALCVITLGDYYASFFREHKLLRKYLNPSYPVYSAGVFVKQAMTSSGPGSYTTIAGRSERQPSDSHLELIVLVIGETARADHFSLNGYTRPTNPELSRSDRLISYSNIAACGTSTAVSVPCMFAQKGREDFSHELSENTENILDLLHRAGVSVLWRDNNSGSKGVAARVAYQNYNSRTVNPVCDTECRDVGMLDGLQDFVDSQNGDILVVLHQKGSHGPAYFKRYPERFERFKPSCKSIELSDCTTDEIVNAYDNTIFYTDHLLARVIDFLEQNTPRYETAMLYVSDHGESLGEGGLYLHGMPYVFAPDAQTRVPVIIWSGVSSDIDYGKSTGLKDAPNSHDALFDTLLDLFEIQTDLRPVNRPPLVYLKRDDD